jgi:poly(3-hydroxybutyrate) depolymerase
MRKSRLLVVTASLVMLACLTRAEAQVTPSDVLFARLSSTTARMAYEQAGGDMKAIAPLFDEANKSAASDPVKAYRAYTQASVMMSGTKWTPDAELTTALDFALNVKVIGAGEYLQTRTTFLFDAPPASSGPYRLDLEILKDENTREAAVEPGIVLGDVRGRRAGEMIGLTFDPSKIVGPGLHLLRATLKDGQGKALYQYYRSFFIVNDLNKRMAAVEKMADLLADTQSLAATTARYSIDAVRLARQTYLGGSFQNLTGFLHTTYRARGFAASELMNFDAALTEATALAAALKEGRNPIPETRGHLRLAYRSSFDGKLVPYRVYVPTTYDRSKAYPMITMLHGAGGDENNFMDRYDGLWPKLAEQRGYIVVAVNGRGPVSGYAKANGAEQDVLDVTALVQKHYNIDPARVYMAGHSMGSAGTWAIGLEYRDRFAALAPIAGTRMNPALEAALKAGRRMPIIIVAGVKDALVPVAGCREVAEKAKALGHEVKYLEYPDGDHISVVASSVKDIFDFFDAHRKVTP